MGAKRSSAGAGGGLAAELARSYQDDALGKVTGLHLPSQQELAALFEELRDLLFPGLTGRPVPRSRPAVARRLAQIERRLAKQVLVGLRHRASRSGQKPLPTLPQAQQMTRRFLEQLPSLRQQLAADVLAAYDGDPAATGTDEVVFCYPGVYAITAYRVAHALLDVGAPVLPRLLTEHAHGRTGIDIHPGATIGASFFIDHGTGVVIGETTVIGARVRVYQGVTLGALSVPEGQQLRGKKRHPTLDDDVIIYANATILGGDTIIGRGAVIGGNTWVTQSVPPGARVSTSR